MQHEILKSDDLLDGSGNLKEPGFAKTALPIYRRDAIKANALRIKEWDYYLIANDDFGVALTIADNSYMGLDSISFLHYREGWEKTLSFMQLLTFGKKKLPASSDTGDISVQGKTYHISFKHDGDKRILEFHVENFKDGQPFSGTINLFDEPEQCTVIATPFDKAGHFYYNRKINCLRADGKVTLSGQDYLFEHDDSFGVLDWGRGVWTYKNTWYWGSASGLVDGIPFGFNIGYGFGNTSAASENMVLYNGKAHKLSQVTFNIPQKADGSEDYMNPWTFTSDDGRFEMTFKPLLDRASKTSLFILVSDQHQVFGRFSGQVTLDSGSIIRIHDFLGFAEKVKNKW